MNETRYSSGQSSRFKKIFGIGFHKTGTKSLAQAFTNLGYRVTGPNFANDVETRDTLFDRASSLIEDFDAFQDNPWPIFYKEIDQQYPKSKFVLTIRPPQDWLGSIVSHFGMKSTPMRELIYGVGMPLGYEDTYLDIYERHNEDVLAYFHNRPDDLLVMDITAGDGWEKLCPFLGHAAPDSNFPFENSSTNRYR